MRRVLTKRQGRWPGSRPQSGGTLKRKAAGALALIGWNVAFGATVAAQSPVFVDVTDAAGVRYLQHTITSECVGTIGCQEDRQTGGAAVTDYNNDGWPDIYVTRFDAPDILFRNRGDGTFENASSAAAITQNFRTNGVGWADFDNDGDQDLYLTSLGGDAANNARFYLYTNNGSGRFTERGRILGAAFDEAAFHGGTSVAFGDYDRDGWIDIHTCEWNGTKYPSFSRLQRNLGAQGSLAFEDVTEASGLIVYNLLPIGIGAWSFTSTFADLDDDGWPDLALAGDFRSSRLFWNNHDGTFVDGTSMSGVGSDEFGMGASVADYDGDGRLDWFVTSIMPVGGVCPRSVDGVPCTGNRLYRNEGGRFFSDRTEPAGVRDGGWGWGSVFIDYDNDGDRDLAMTNGVNYSAAPFDPFLSDPNRFWRNDGGTFTEIAGQVGFTDTGTGKGMLTFDYDRDGDLDIFFVNNGESGHLLRNDGGAEAGGWIRVRVQGTQTNRDGFGAKIRVKATAGAPAQVWEIGSECVFLSQSERIAHFGLGPGADPVAEVRVSWPKSGTEQVFTNVARNTTLLVIEGFGTATPTPSLTPSPSPSASPTPSSTPSPTATPSATASPSETASASPTETPSPSATPSISPTPAGSAENIRLWLLGEGSDPSGLDLNGDGVIDIADYCLAIQP